MWADLERRQPLGPGQPVLYRPAELPEILMPVTALQTNLRMLLVLPRLWIMSSSIRLGWTPNQTRRLQHRSRKLSSMV